MKHLNLSSNRITDLKGTDFPKSLELIDVTDNRIQRLIPNSFKLPNLRKLILSRNRIKSLRQDVFSGYLDGTGLRNMKFLDVSHNRLTGISSLTFNELVDLVRLDLRHNLIDTLDDGAFYGMHSLKVLNLDYNRLETMDKGWLYQMSGLKQL